MVFGLSALNREYTSDGNYTGQLVSLPPVVIVKFVFYLQYYVAVLLQVPRLNKPIFLYTDPQLSMTQS